jgi:hypothetical protein
MRPPSEKCLAKLTETRTYQGKTGNITTSGKFKNMKIHCTSCIVRVSGSLTKYLLTNNIKNLSRTQVKAAIESLSKELDLPLQNAIVTRMDVGHCFEMAHPVAEYLEHLGSARYYKQCDFNDKETKYYKTCNRELIFYDKFAEMRKKGQALDANLPGKYLLRFEKRYKKIPSGKFGLKIFRGRHLYDRQIWAAIARNYVDEYRLILKIALYELQLDTSNLKNFTISLARRGLKNDGIELAYNSIKCARFNGEMDKKKAQRFRRHIKLLCTHPHAETHETHISELDKKVAAILPRQLNDTINPSPAKRSPYGSNHSRKRVLHRPRTRRQTQRLAQIGG